MKMAYLSEEQLKTLLRSVPVDRWQLMLLVTYWHGMRVSETLSLTPQDVRSGYLTINRLKGSKSTTQPLIHHPDPLLNESTRLTALAQSVPIGEFLFPISRRGVHKMMQRYGLKAGLPGPLLHPHSLKHSIAKHGLKRGMTLPDIQALLGHKSLSSTGEYLKVSDLEAAESLHKAMGINMGQIAHAGVVNSI